MESFSKLVRNVFCPFCGSTVAAQPHKHVAILIAFFSELLMTEVYFVITKKAT